MSVHVQQGHSQDFEKGVWGGGGGGANNHDYITIIKLKSLQWMNKFLSKFYRHYSCVMG